MIKKFFLFIIVFSILTSCIIHVSALAVDTSGECVILMEADSKDILYEKNSDEKMLIASITKVLTALVVLENSGHYAFLDEMFAFNKILASFMNI